MTGRAERLAAVIAIVLFVAVLAALVLVEGWWGL